MNATPPILGSSVSAFRRSGHEPSENTTASVSREIVGCSDFAPIGYRMDRHSLSAASIASLISERAEREYWRSEPQSWA